MIARFLKYFLMRALYNPCNLIYLFRYEPGEDFEFRELVFKHYSCEVNAQQLSALVDMLRIYYPFVEAASDECS